MRAIIQRVSSASVEVEGKIAGTINSGMLILLGVGEDDTDDDLEMLLKKIPLFRIFPDSEGKMNLSLLDTKGSILAVSQFTLFGTWKKGNRPGFTDAAPPEKGEEYYNRFVTGLREQGITVETGIFGAMMNVSLVNQGPVTFTLDTKCPV